MLPYSGFPALPDKMEDMHKQLVALGLNDVEALTSRIKKCEAWVADVEETELTGNPVTFNNALALPAIDCEATLSPVQDLHGYDHPWADGWGKNVLQMTLPYLKDVNTAGTWNGNVYTYNGGTFTVYTDNDDNVTGIEVNGTFTAQAGFNCSNILTGIGGDFYFNGCADGGGYETNFDLYCWCVTDSARPKRWDGTTNSASAINSSDDCEIKLDSAKRYQLVLRVRATTITHKMFYPMIRLGTISDKTFAPYSNKCSISGRTSSTVDDVGKNMLHTVLADIKTANTEGTWSGNVYTINGGTITVNTDSDGNVTSIKANGTFTGYSYLFIDTNFDSNDLVGCLFNGLPSEGGNNSFMFRVSSQSDVTALQNFMSNNLAVQAVGNDLRLSLRISSGYTANNLIFKPMVRKSTDSADFAPYAHSSATIQLGTTVYGGEVNFDTGVAIVNMGMLNLGDLTWTLATGDRFLAINQMPNVKISTAASEVRNAICSQYVWKAGSVLFNNPDAGFSYYIETNQNRLFVKDLTYPDAASFKTAMNGVQLCYELAEPIELDLTPTQLQMLKGYNRVSSDDASSITIKAYTGGPWEPITRTIKKVTNKTKTTKKRRK